MTQLRFLLFGILLLGNDAVKVDLNASSYLVQRSTRSVIFTGPYLDGQDFTNVTTQIGTHAFLPCRVKQLGNKSVSWIRVRDDHILSVDRVTFIADERFQSYFVESDSIWTLQIKYVQARDEGTYECQVSTEPKVSARVHLKVVVPKTEIVGEAERYVKAGSTVILRCVVRGALIAPSYIFWSHGVRQIFPDNRDGWRAQIDKGLPGIDGDTHSTIGSLLITSVKKKDAGNYTCSPSNSDSVTFSLHVINGEYLASAITSSATQEEYRNLIVFSLLIIGTLQT